MTLSQRGIWSLSLASLVGALFLLTMAGLSLDLAGSEASLILLATAAILAGLRRRMSATPMLRLLDFFEMLALFAMISTAGLILTYAAAGVSGPYVDELLASADRAMGFDWMILYDFMDAHRDLMFVSKQIYFSIFATPILIAAAHAWTGEREHYNMFLLAYLLSLIVTAALFLFYPAQSAVPYYLGSNPSYPAAVIDQHVLAIDAIKAGELKTVNLARALGLVAFPSFHAAAGILFIWAAWPFRRLRLPLLVLNMAMIVTALVEGSHYLTDILGGILVALGSISAVMLRGTSKHLAGSGRWIPRPIAKDAHHPFGS